LAFFIAKYFGSGVIIATAWMHLLSPASESLGNECLGNILPEYDWAMGIGLMTVMVMFLIELVVSNYNLVSGGHSHDHGKDSDDLAASEIRLTPLADDPEALKSTKKVPSRSEGRFSDSRIPGIPDDVSYPPGGQDHLGHQREHVAGQEQSAAEFAAQMTAIFILEFGVIFHSIFIGLTLAVAEDFVILFIVLVFHQTFEGLGLGSRLATINWPLSKRWMPYILGGMYSLTTPIAIAIGLGVRESLQTEAATMLIVNGVFDAISGGILMYTGLVELLAHEFMFNPEMRKAGFKMQFFAYLCVCAGVALMALLAKWA
jgi:zinc transporter 1/2/3